MRSGIGSPGSGPPKTRADGALKQLWGWGSMNRGGVAGVRQQGNPIRMRERCIRCTARLPVLGVVSNRASLLDSSWPAPYSADARPGRAEVAVNVFGFSKHFKESADGRARVQPGRRVAVERSQSRRGSLETNVGVYSDSFGHAAWHWSLGGRWRVQGPFELGLQLINGASASHNEGYPVLVPYPFVAARLNRVTLNIAYLPEAGGVNGVPALATYVTVRPWRQSSEEKASATADSVSHSAMEFGLRYLGMYNNLGTSGITWRHMFDEGHGLRIGFSA